MVVKQGSSRRPLPEQRPRRGLDQRRTRRLPVSPRRPPCGSRVPSAPHPACRPNTRISCEARTTQGWSAPLRALHSAPTAPRQLHPIVGLPHALSACGLPGRTAPLRNPATACAPMVRRLRARVVRLGCHAPAFPAAHWRLPQDVRRCKRLAEERGASQPRSSPWSGALCRIRTAEPREPFARASLESEASDGNMHMAPACSAVPGYSGRP